MKIAILTDSAQRGHLEHIFSQLSHLPPATFFHSYDDFIDRLPRSGCRVVIIAQEGAGGMESARAAKILLPEAPLIWFSDDRGFGPESYRVGCSYFSAAPITRELVLKALAQCS